MNQTESAFIFIIAAFSFALVLIFKKDEIPPSMKRGLAILAIVMVSFAFFLILFSFLNMS